MYTQTFKILKLLCILKPRETKYIVFLLHFFISEYKLEAADIDTFSCHFS